MQRWKNILFNISLFLNGLLVFLLLLESRLSIPPWLQVAGRMHPMVLHFPLVLIILYIITSFLPRANYTAAEKELPALLLLGAAFTSALTAVLGLLLSKEPGYDTTALVWHKWGGAAIAVSTLAWYYFRQALSGSRLLSSGVSFFALLLIVITGHQGAGITHGQNFLLAPILPEEKEKDILPEEAIVYEDMVRPILQRKCMSCHNSKKAKGELIMETEALLIKGGKSGMLWNTTPGDRGLLLQRIHLPIEEKKHMPPQGKPALSDDEIAIITQWISKGADFKLRVAALPVTDTLRQLANTMFGKKEAATYTFEKADEATIKKLNTVNRVVTEEAQNSPALAVSFFNSQLFLPEQLKELSVIKKQVVSLDLSKMPLKADDLKMIGELENLQTLNLSFTGIDGAALPALQKLQSLRSLSLAGTRLGMADLKSLQKLPALKTVYTWNTGINDAELQQLKTTIGSIHWEAGFRGDTMILQLSPPVFDNEKDLITEPVALQLKHYIKGAEIRYTIDGTDPDSLHSPVFQQNVSITTNMHIKAKAYKAGWSSSDIVEHDFYRAKYTPDTVIFLNQPDPSYKGDGHILVDKEKGEMNFKTGKWLAWRQSNMELLMHYSTPVTIGNVTLSTLEDADKYIMPPVFIEVWGGTDPQHLKLLSKLTPPQLSKLRPGGLHGYGCSFAPATVQYIKLVAAPLMKLPGWHPAKGDKGWLFVDEILTN